MLEVINVAYKKEFTNIENMLDMIQETASQSENEMEHTALESLV